MGIPTGDHKIINICSRLFPGVIRKLMKKITFPGKGAYKIHTNYLSYGNIFINLYFYPLTLSLTVPKYIITILLSSTVRLTQR